MGKPVWVTRAGNLGTLEEGVFYELRIEAFDPAGGELEYQVIAGYMPPGLVMDERTGIIYGRPKDLYYIRGVPFEVNEDETSTFCCRLTSEDGQIADRTFSITVTGQDAPTLITLEQELARVFDGTYVDITLEAQDLDNEPIEWSVVSGELPVGLTLDSQTGRIFGYTRPVESQANQETVGWSAPEAGWEEYLWDHSEAWINQNYQFTVQITDGKEYAQKTYTIFVLSKSLLTGDLDSITADSLETITADMDNKHAPALLTLSQDLGIYEHDNYFSFQFTGIDFDNEQIEFGITTGDTAGFDSVGGSGFDSDLFDQGGLSLPPGLTLNTETGWLYGYITPQLSAQVEYNFAAYAYKKADPSSRSSLVYFTVTIVSDLANAVIWQTPNALGTIGTGEISELGVESTNQFGYQINYSLESGSQLPQGLALLPNGLIIGRASFEYTSFDQGTTTFDFDIRELGARLPETTLDRTYTFTVKAASPGNELIAYRTFTVTVDPTNYNPYESIYFKAMPGQADKDLFSSITKNTDMIPSSDVYRNGDPYFGRAADARVLLLSGLNPKSAQEYTAAMSVNHYRKILTFGEPKVGKAYDESQNLIYEVLYYEMQDRLETQSGSVPESIDLNNQIRRNITVDTEDVTIDSQYHTIDGAGDRIVYPNSLVNMRNQLIDTIGLSDREVLPLWMKNRQLDGSIVGWKPVVVLAYMKPGTGARALFNLKRRVDLDQKLVSFDFDRYIWDNNLTKNYNTETDEYLASVKTTFDIIQDWDSPDPVATVDAALNIPFNQFDGRTTEFIDNAGGLDGLVDVYDDKTVIFATQEQYTGYNEPEDGWIFNGSFWDDNSGWGTVFDDYSVIPGYAQKQADPQNTTNQRAGIWKFVRDTENDILRLEFQREIAQGETVLVSNGFTYGGRLLQYDELIQFDEGKTVPYYQDVEGLEFSTETVFDNNQTTFAANVSIYEDPDQSDKYLVFPRKSIWA